MPLLDPIPSPVESADFTALEWEPLLVLVAGFAASPVGRQAILDLRPSTDENWITRQHQLTGEVRLLLEEQVSIPCGGLFDPTQLAAKARIPDAALEANELQAIARLANDVAAWQALLQQPPARLVGKLPGLSECSSGLTASLKPLAETIARNIQPDGTLADNASPELSRIRREQERQQRIIEESLRSALRKLSSEGSTQEDLITMRGDRFVIPVRAELKRRISGVVHGASSSGQTVYVEPLETIEQNNELVRLLEEEQAEIHRIFVALTRQVATYAAGLVEGARVLALIDTLQARARFARDFDCVAPSITPDLLHLEAARHPLLEKRLRATGAKPNTAVVPLTLELDRRTSPAHHQRPQHRRQNRHPQNHRAARHDGAGRPARSRRRCQLSRSSPPSSPTSAMPSPSKPRSPPSPRTSPTSTASRASPVRTPLSCSTNSAPPPTPKKARHSPSPSPRYFLAAGAWSLISTHHTSLKVYAANTPGVLNAAAGVDEATLAPNYQLRLGVPGASAGIQTAERLGLNAAIITAARQRLGSQQVDIARFLDKLHNELTALEAERKAAREQQYALNQERAKLAREGDVELRNRTRELETKLASLLKEFEFQMRENVRAIEDRAAQQKLSKEAERRIQRLRREFQESFNQTVVAHRTGADQGDANAQPHLLEAHRPRRSGPHQVHEQDRHRPARSREGSLRSRPRPHQDARQARRALSSPQPNASASGRSPTRSPPPASRKTSTSPSPAPTPTTCAWRSTSSAAPSTKPPRNWKSISTAPSSPACRAFASSTATAPASSAAASATSSRAIPT